MKDKIGLYDAIISDRSKSGEISESSENSDSSNDTNSDKSMSSRVESKIFSNIYGNFEPVAKLPPLSIQRSYSEELNKSDKLLKSSEQNTSEKIFYTKYLKYKTKYLHLKKLNNVKQ